jgi:TIR domain
MAKDVFISHSSQDSALASLVCHFLEARGLRCWMAPRDIQHGQPWGASIVHALDECPVLVLLLTTQANASRHVVREVERADGKRAHIITFRADNVVLDPSLEYFLSADHWLDAVSRPIESHLPALLDAAKTLCGMARNAAKAPSLALSATLAPSPMSDSELADTFDEQAPDDWNRLPRSVIGRYLQKLFDDR